MSEYASGAGWVLDRVITCKESKRAVIKIGATTRAADDTPEGKRRIRRTVWGNLNGYVSGRFWLTFGTQYDPTAERQAEAWLRGDKDWRDA